MTFIDIPEGTSHAGYSETLSRFAGFDVYINNVTYNKSGNRSIIEFEGDGHLANWTGLSSIMVNGVRYIDKVTDTVYVGIKNGDDVEFSSTPSTNPSTPPLAPIDVSNVLTYTVNHSGNHLVVQTIDSSGIQTEATVQHTSPTAFTVSWTSPFTGKIILAKY